MQNLWKCTVISSMKLVSPDYLSEFKRIRSVIVEHIKDQTVVYTTILKVCVSFNFVQLQVERSSDENKMLIKFSSQFRDIRKQIRRCQNDWKRNARETMSLRITHWSFIPLSKFKKILPSSKKKFCFMLLDWILCKCDIANFHLTAPC